MVIFACALAAIAVLFVAVVWLTLEARLTRLALSQSTMLSSLHSLEGRLERSQSASVAANVDALDAALAQHVRGTRKELGKLWAKHAEPAVADAPLTRDQLRTQHSGAILKAHS